MAACSSPQFGEGLDPATLYEVKELDEGEPEQATGRQLMEEGLLVTIGEQPGAVIIAFARRSP